MQICLVSNSGKKKIVQIILSLLHDCGLYILKTGNGTCTDKSPLTLSCVEGEVDRLLCTQCAVSEGSDGHCILCHCLQT